MIGEKLGNYTIVELVGSGSMGTVYRAEDPMGRPVAVKYVRSQLLYSMEKRERFLQCILTASGIRHESICPILDVGDDNDDFFVIMPFIRSRTLAQHMDGRARWWPETLRTALAISAALEAVHEAGVAHRGLNPGNIWVLNESGPSLLLADCCISRFTEIGRRSRSRQCKAGIEFADTLIPLNALAYMSPEQLRGEPVDYRTDIFSLGVILYEMLSARHPFEAPGSVCRISAILDAEPPALASRQDPVLEQADGVLRKALAKNREERYQSIHALMEDLKSLPPASLPGSSPRARSWLRSLFNRK